MKIFLPLCWFAAAAVAAFAQTKSDSDLFAEAMALRETMTAAIVKGDEKPAPAMERLRAHAAPSGLKVEREADFAFAAIDVGQRLLAAGKAVEAEEFFQAAEKSLVRVIQKTKDEAAQEKALYLQQLAFIRANFLNEDEAARDDLEAAVKLQPNDEYLKMRKVNHACDKAERLKSQAKN